MIPDPGSIQLQCTAIRIGIVVYEPPLVRPQKEWLYNLGGMQGDL